MPSNAMMFFRRVDDFLIDRVFQPIADALDRWVSCYGIAAFLLTGFGLERIIYSVSRGTWISLLFISAWLPISIVRAYKLEAEDARDIMPMNRISNLFGRFAYLAVIAPGSIAMLCTASNVIQAIDSLGWLSLCIAEYFMACRRRPPRRKKTKVLVGPYCPQSGATR